MPMISEDDDTEWPKHSLGAPEVAHTRAASSGGGLNPISLYLVLSNVATLEDGIYVYLPFGHCLRKVMAFNEQRRKAHLALARSWGPNIDPGKVNLTIYYVYTVYENSRKYGDLGRLSASLKQARSPHTFTSSVPPRRSVLRIWAAGKKSRPSDSSALTDSPSSWYIRQSSG